MKQRGARSAGNPLAALRRGGDWNGAVEIPAGAPVFDPYTFVGDCPWLGTLDRWFLAGMTHDSVNPAAKTIPEALFMLYQMTFAIITVALVALSVADSMRLCAYLVFSVGRFIFATFGWRTGSGATATLPAWAYWIVRAPPRAPLRRPRGCAMIGRHHGYGTENLSPFDLSCTVMAPNYCGSAGWLQRRLGIGGQRAGAGDHRHASCGLCGQ